MAFQELQAMQVAYELLSPLEPGAQRRVMAWLSAALADDQSVPAALDEPGRPVSRVPELAATGSSDSDVDVSAKRATTSSEVDSAAESVTTAGANGAAEAEIAVEPASRPRPVGRRSGKASGRRAAPSESAAAATPAEARRGRRGERPSGGQFLGDLAAVGSFKALAEKYGKSVGTIGNWANQLREEGFDIPVGRQKR